MSQFYKYKRTFHLPFSEGLQNDDKRMEDETCFDGKTVAVTVKMDGSNNSLYKDGLHARSLDSSHHPSRSWLKSYHSTFAHLIPDGWRICGEGLFAKHSIHYTDLESYFYVFSVWDENNICLSLTDTKKFCDKLGLTHVEVVCVVEDLGQGCLMEILELVYHNVVSQGQEGIVIRNVESYHYDDFQNNIAKAVRANHIQTDENWKSEAIVKNLLKGDYENSKSLSLL